jgi:betaine-aldehyde dehydrogenase
MNNGQACVAQTRILAPRSRYDEIVDAVTTAVGEMKVGDPTDFETEVGPLIAERQRDRVEGYIAKGRDEGARLTVGGGRPDLDKGWFVQPTVFADVTNQMTIAREEIFGPVMSVIPFDDEKDALRIANDTPFGLAAAVWSRDIFKCFRMVKRLQAGIVWVNHMQPTYVEAPWGGYKMSGIGRELGPWGAEEYLQVKQVHVNLNEAPIGWY